MCNKLFLTLNQTVFEIINISYILCTITVYVKKYLINNNVRRLDQLLTISWLLTSRQEEEEATLTSETN